MFSPKSGSYFIMGSHLTGWAANPAMLFRASAATPCNAKWFISQAGTPWAAVGAKLQLSHNLSLLLLPDQCQGLRIRIASLRSTLTWGWLPSAVFAAAADMHACADSPVKGLARQQPLTARPPLCCPSPTRTAPPCSSTWETAGMRGVPDRYDI